MKISKVYEVRQYDKNNPNPNMSIYEGDFYHKENAKNFIKNQLKEDKTKKFFIITRYEADEYATELEKHDE